MMLQNKYQADSPPPMGSEDAAGKMTIPSRFGELRFGPNNLVRLPKGLLGFTAYHNFGLANFPKREFSHFKILQCLEDPALSFLVSPLDLDAGLIARKDMEEIYEQLAIQKEDGAVLLILTVRQEDGKSVISANLRAPIFVDTRRHVGRQCVLANPDYAIRHVL